MSAFFGGHWRKCILPCYEKGMNMDYDLSAAFDTVDHTICICRLSHLYGVDGTVLQWFESFLSNRDNKVCVNDVFSLSRDAHCGVPQGSVLGARLYTCMYTH